MLIEVTGNFVRGDEVKEGRFFINPAHVLLITANGTKANFHITGGITLYSDANLADVLKLMEEALRPPDRDDD